MGNKYIKTVAGGENTSPAGTEALLLDDGAAYKYSLLTTIRTFFKTTYDALYMALVAPGTSGNVLTSNGSIWASAAPTAGDKYPMEARLTLETDVAVSTTAQTAKTTLYLTKYKGDQIAVFSGTAWSNIALGADISITLALLTANLPYDVFVYSNAGTLTLELTAWTNITTRATALTTQNGVYVKTGATTRRYVGTICITATTGQCEDSESSRLVYNYYNQVQRYFSAIDTTDNWNYTTATWRAANNSTVLGVMRVGCVVGVAEQPIKICVYSFSFNTNAAGQHAGIGINATDTNSAKVFGGLGLAGGYVMQNSQLMKQLAVGYNYIQRLEFSQAAGTTTWYGDQTGVIQTGMIADMSM